MNREPATLAEALTRIHALEQEVVDVRRALSTVRSASVTLIGSMHARTLEEERVLRSLATKDRREVLVDLDAAREEARRWNEAATELAERTEAAERSEVAAVARASKLALDLQTAQSEAAEARRDVRHRDETIASLRLTVREVSSACQTLVERCERAESARDESAGCAEALHAEIERLRAELDAVQFSRERSAKFDLTEVRSDAPKTDGGGHDT